MSDNDDGQIYLAVVNHEEQYSIWPAQREVPAGWRGAGKQGSKAECLSYIGEVWTDMRPLSLRKHMEELARNPPAPEPEVTASDTRPSLVKRLAEGLHKVRFSSRPECSVVALKQSIDRGYAHILFPQTEGGTELGVRIDAASSDLSKADFASGSGEVKLVGSLVLDGVRVQCSAHLDLATLEGKGNLRLLD
jgi:uncharacterized protein YbdZ (MbtH family)